MKTERTHTEQGIRTYMSLSFLPVCGLSSEKTWARFDIQPVNIVPDGVGYV